MTPKSHDGIVESIWALRVAFTSARNSRTRVANQIRDLIITAPDQLREVLGPLSSHRNGYHAASGFAPPESWPSRSKA